MDVYMFYRGAPNGWVDWHRGIIIIIIICYAVKP